MKKVTPKLVAVLVMSTIAATSALVLGADKHFKNEGIGIERAEQLALQAQPGKLLDIEREYVRGRAVFEVEIATAQGEIELMLDAHTATVIAHKMADELDLNDEDIHQDDDDDSTDSQGEQPREDDD